MKTNTFRSSLFSAAVVSSALLAACTDARTHGEAIGAAEDALKVLNSGSYNLHLEETVRFKATDPGADPVRGRALFGIAADLETEDKSQAIFEGHSDAFGGVVVSNQRTCFTCHRGLSVQLGLPAAPLSATIPLTDALFTGIDGDAQGDPDAMHNLDTLALVKYRPGRFNLTRDEGDPFRQVFFWRKSIRLLNLGLTNGFLNDARSRTMFETDRGAVFSHTQSSDVRFDDLFQLKDGSDMEAFQFSQFTDPALAALRDPSDPMYTALVSDPFYTVHATTKLQKKGQEVFKASCMDCHNTPNVFNNVSNIEAVGNGERLQSFPPSPPSVARTFNVGISERNKHNLRFTRDLGGGQFAPIILPLVNGQGVVTQLTVTFDVGLAATTARTEDIGRFKVPQLRGLLNNAPYFHDNSAATIAEVVDYFNSDAYNHSRDGKLHPIHLDAGERAALIAFLKIL